MSIALRRLVKWGYIFVALLLITLAVIVQLGRSFSHLIADYKEPLSDYLSETLNARVSVETIDAQWDGLRPSLSVTGLRIANQQEEALVSLQTAQVRFDILRSLIARRVVWNSILLNDVELEFEQTVDGKWQLQGFLNQASPDTPQRAERKDEIRKDDVNLDQLIDMLLLSNRIEFVSTKLRFVFTEGQEVLLQAPSLLLENSGDFHRLLLSVDAGTETNNVKLILEGMGDPRDQENFRSKGYLEIRSFPTREVLAATSDFLFHGMDYEFLKGDGDIQAKVWLQSSEDGSGYDLSGQLDLQRIEVAAGKMAVQLDDVSTLVVGRWNFDENWMLQLQQFQSKYGENNLREVSIQIDYDKKESEVNLAFDQINLQQFHGLLDASGAIGQGRLSEILRDLNPRGNLKSLWVNVPLVSPKSWQVRGQLDKVFIDAWRGVPTLTALDGYVTADADSGGIWINSGDKFSMHFIPTYDAPMTFDNAKGHVAWHLRPEENRIYVNSGALQFRHQDTKLLGHMLLDMPLKPKNNETPRIDLTLQISAQDLPVKDYSTYVPSLLPESLITWLDTAIGSDNPGVAHQVGLLYRADLANKDPVTKVFNLYIDSQGTRLDYHSQWPQLTDMSGKIWIRDASVDAFINRGNLHQSLLSNTNLTIRPLSDGGSLMHLTGELVGPAVDVLNTTRQGQLRNAIGDKMDAWQLDGHATTQIQLSLPVAVEDSSISQQLTAYKVDTQLSDARLQMTDLNLSFSNLQGQISYRHDIGFANTHLTGNLFSHPFTAAIKTETNNDSAEPSGRRSSIYLDGVVASETLAEWSRRPEVYFLQGDISFDARVDIFHAEKSDQSLDARLPQSLSTFSADASARVNIQSDLDGVVVSLPGDLLKVAKEKSALSFDMWVKPEAWQFDIRYQNKLNALLHLDSSSKNLINASLGLNSLANFSAASEFFVSGALPEFDIQLWKNVFARYQDHQARLDAALGVMASVEDSDAEPAIRNVAGLPFRAQVNLEKHQIGPVVLNDLKVEARPVPYGWNLQLENKVLAGQVIIPDSQYLPLELNIDHLYLPESALNRPHAVVSEFAVQSVGEQVSSENAISGDESEDEQKAVAPVFAADDLPAARVAIANLFLADEPLGAWAFETKPTSQGVVIDNIEGAIRGLRFSGESEKAQGAQLIWRDVGGEVQSRFIGVVTAENLAEVSKRWQVPQLLESESARFVADIQWPGTPAEIQLVTLAGKVDLTLQKGRFYRNAGAGDGLLRLMSVVNFDSIARRLKLDFSDLYQSGLAYDSVVGEANFNNGVMRFTKPLDLKGPSSRLQLAGTVDLKNEQINSRLIATLPVAGNLTFAAALITGLPAAVGVYVVSKLFKKQVDRATSISYEIKGSWDEPVVRFTRFFESEESLSQLNDSDPTESADGSIEQASSSLVENDGEVDIQALEALIQEGVNEAQNEKKAP